MDIPWKRLEKLTKAASTTLEAVVSIREATSPLGMASAILKGSSTLLESKSEEDPQKSGAYVALYMHPHLDSMLSPWMESRGVVGKYRRYDLLGRRAYVENSWLYVQGDSTCSNLQRTLLREASQKLWECHGRRLTLSFSSLNGDVAFSPNKDTGLPSPQGSAIAERVRKFLISEESRTLILHGPPGTGKSQMALHVAQQLGRYTLVIPASQLDASSLKYAVQYVDYLRPSVLVVDDIDQVRASSSDLLSFVDNVRGLVDIFISTANRLSTLDSAVLRAGRIDEVVEVLSIRRVEDIIPGLSAEQYAKVRDWPVAFQVELNRRLTALGRECFSSEFESLAEREKLNQDYSR